jgi:hypothetical protein
MALPRAFGVRQKTVVLAGSVFSVGRLGNLPIETVNTREASANRAEASLLFRIAHALRRVPERADHDVMIECGLGVTNEVSIELHVSRAATAVAQPVEKLAAAIQVGRGLLNRE